MALPVLGVLKSFKLWVGVGVVALIGGATWWHFSSVGDLRDKYSDSQELIGKQQQSLKDLKSSFDNYREETKEILAAHQERAQDLRNRYQDIREETQRINNILSEHDLANLAYEKPGLIESRINDGTERVFSDLGESTNEFSRSQPSSEGSDSGSAGGDESEGS